MNDLLLRTQWVTQSRSFEPAFWRNALRPFGAHFGAQKMIFNRFALKSGPLDRLDASAGMTFVENGAKETRTPDPLNAMKILAKLRSVATTSNNTSGNGAFGRSLTHLRQLAIARKGKNQT